MKISRPILVCIAILAMVHIQLIKADDTLPLFARGETIRQEVNLEIANPGFETAGGWVQADGSPFIPTKTCCSGKQACRLNGGMVKTALIQLNEGEELFFSAQTKVDNLRVIEAETAFFDANGNWLQDGSGPLARGDQYSWQKISGHFLNTRSNVRYVTLQFYGSGELDDIKLWKRLKARENGDKAKAKLNIELSRESNSNFIYLSNSNFEAWISRKTGLLSKLVSLLPVPKVIQPSGWNSMQIYLKSEDGKYDGDFDTLSKIEKSSPNTYICHLTSSAPNIASRANVVLTYEFLPERLDITVDYHFKKNDQRKFQFGIRNVFRAKEWKNCIYPTFPATCVASDKVIRAAFNYTPGDHTNKNITSQLPFAFLESDDRIMAWGSLDLGKSSVLTANDIAWRLPSMQLSSDRLTEGTSRTLHSFYAIFPKADHELTQAMKYCIDNISCSHPLMKELIEKRDRQPRKFTNGAFAWYHPGAVPPGCDGWRRDMLDRFANNVWYSWWANWNEECLTTGDWHTYDCRHLSANGLKKEIAYMQDMGLNVYLYFRQFLAENGTYNDRPPYKKWLGRDEAGHRQAFIDFPVPYPQMLGGQDKVQWTMADFGQKECRQWYVDMVKQCIDFYRPKGLAWDMGFSSAYSTGEPDVGLGLGTLWIQAEIYNYLKEKYPEMRIATNESFCSPSALFGDCILIEGAWRVGKKTPLDYRLAQGFGKTIFSLQLIDDYLIQLMPYHETAQYTHLKIKAKAENLIEASAGGDDLVKNGLALDGKWHLLTIPFHTAGFRTVDLHVRTGDANGGYLEVAEAELISESNPSISPLVLLNQASLADDFVTSRKWYHREPGIGRVEKTTDGLRISVDGVNKAYDAFSIATVRQEWEMLNLKVLALGGICSDAQIPSWNEYNKFAAHLAEMLPIVHKKVLYHAPEGIYGSFWSNGNNIAGAIYNESGVEQMLSLHLDRNALPDQGNSFAADSGILRMVTPDGKMLKTDSVGISMAEGSIIIHGKMPQGHLLVFSTEKQHLNP